MSGVYAYPAQEYYSGVLLSSFCLFPNDLSMIITNQHSNLESIEVDKKGACKHSLIEYNISYTQL
jgi:hypothetical protein